jgi:hypothetical protein
MVIKKDKTKKRKRHEPSRKATSRTEILETQRQVLQNMKSDPTPITTPLRRNVYDAMERRLA